MKIVLEITGKVVNKVNKPRPKTNSLLPGFLNAMRSSG
ncbi:hypothetical protein EV14_1468 [Prochlorococcus sp. MIT 0703]|nr:hypothetical protein EV14_1468 [Prochlorococcus sp. MIT 0703]